MSTGGDLHEWRILHKTLFHDVYDWARKLRTIDVRKRVPEANAFARRSVIAHLAAVHACVGREDDMLGGLDRDGFAKRLASHDEETASPRWQISGEYSDLTTLHSGS